MIYDLVKASRSYRGYDHSYKFTEEQLKSYVECARFCPSSVNKQPLKYFIACDDQMVVRIQKETHWAKALPELTLPHPGKEPSAFIVICQDDTIDPSLARYQRDIGIVAQTMLLAAAEEGLGGCMIGNFAADSLRNALGLPENIHPMLVVAFGKPDDEIRIVEVQDGNTNYYRDGNDTHYVPKRSLEEILL